MMRAMLFHSDEEIQTRIARFKSANPPDSVSYLERLRPAIIGFHVDGYSRAMMFKGLTAERLISCSRTAFYRWLDANVDLNQEARAFVEKGDARESRGEPIARSAPAPTAAQKTAQQKERRASAPGPAKRDREPPNDASAAGAGGELPQSPTSSTTVKSTVESTRDTAGSDAAAERRRLVAALNSTLQEAESQDMGAVSDRAHARLAERDRGRGGRDG